MLPTLSSRFGRAAEAAVFILTGLAAVQTAGVLPAQDNVLVYGNSIVKGNNAGSNRAALFFADVVEQSGQPRPNVVEHVFNNLSTANYLSNAAKITNSLPVGVTWDAMIVQGNTVETTPLFGFDPADFLSNMDALGAALFAHSPQAQFVGHETGADHPDGSVYPVWFADPAEWLGFPQAAYEAARLSIDAAHPASPPVKIANQGTAFAETTGYDLSLFEPDLHHLDDAGQILCAMLWYQEIYGGRLCDLVVDYGVATPLVSRLQQFNVQESEWNRLAGYADRAQPRDERVRPGSDSDFQLRFSVGAGVLTNLCPDRAAQTGDVCNVELTSPLGALQGSAASVYMQFTAQGVTPVPTPIPGSHLDANVSAVLVTFGDLSAASTQFAVPPGLVGLSGWLQGLSLGPSGSSAFPLALTDALKVDLH